MSNTLEVVSQQETSLRSRREARGGMSSTEEATRGNPLLSYSCCPEAEVRDILQGHSSASRIHSLHSSAQWQCQHTTGVTWRNKLRRQGPAEGPLRPASGRQMSVGDGVSWKYVSIYPDGLKRMVRGEFRCFQHSRRIQVAVAVAEGAASRTPSRTFRYHQDIFQHLVSGRQ
jgi:hypothetical protein